MGRFLLGSQVCHFRHTAWIDSRLWRKSARCCDLRLFDILLAFPSILLAIAIVSILGPSLQNALIAIAIINVPTFGRLVRSKVLKY